MCESFENDSILELCENKSRLFGLIRISRSADSWSWQSWSNFSLICRSCICCLSISIIIGVFACIWSNSSVCWWSIRRTRLSISSSGLIAFFYSTSWKSSCGLLSIGGFSITWCLISRRSSNCSISTSIFIWWRRRWRVLRWCHLNSWRTSSNSWWSGWGSCVLVLSQLKFIISHLRF